MNNQEPEARIWATSTDLPDTNQERRRYFLAIEDRGTTTYLELVLGPEKAMAVEPFVPHEMDYTVHDSCDHRAEVNYCVLDDPESPEFADMMENRQYYADRDTHPPKASENWPSVPWPPAKLPPVISELWGFAADTPPTTKEK